MLTFKLHFFSVSAKLLIVFNLFLGDISLTQSNAILRYIARKNDMCGKTEQEKVWVDMMTDEAMDFRNGWVRLCYNPGFVSYSLGVRSIIMIPFL